MILSPSILAADWSILKEELEICEKAGADALHIDVMDGHFVPQISFGSKFIADMKPHSKLFFDVHIMVESPETHVDDMILAGADAITFHIETSWFSHRLISYIKNTYSNIKIGIALNPQTSVSTIESLLPDIDIVLLMGVDPGYGGQTFIPYVLEKIARLKSLQKSMRIQHGLSFEISVDGGVNLNTVQQIVEYGADRLVIGSAFFSAQDKYKFLQEVRAINEK